MEDLLSQTLHIPTNNYDTTQDTEKNNLTLNSANTTQMPPINYTQTIFITATVIFFISITTAGNIFVIYAIFTQNNLKRIGNRLILSLALTDLIVAVLVMPFRAYTEINKSVWVLGPELCEMLYVLDALFCTASIYHLLAIAIHRYCSVTKVAYARNRKRQFIHFLILSSWIISFIVVITPIVVWRDHSFYRKVGEENFCLDREDVPYLVFALFGSFNIPVIVMLGLYLSIFQKAKKRIRNKPGTSPVTLGELKGKDEVQKSNQSVKHKKKFKKDSIEGRRERKVVKTLIIITGACICCWLPFFIIAFVKLICPSCEVDNAVYSFGVWSGYINSTINPIIYTVFSADFRSAFKNILSKICNTQNIESSSSVKNKNNSSQT